MSYFSSIRFSDDAITKSVSGSIRTSQLTTLFDGKILNSDDTNLWDTTGTGVATFQNNTHLLSVTPGTFLIKQSKRMFPYFSGKVQVVEQTFDNFQHEAGVIKRAGYFSSSGTSPFDQNFDGFFLEMDQNGLLAIKSFNFGASTANIPFEQWHNYLLLKNYDFSTFTVIMWEFLWLGGAALRLWINTPDFGFVSAHTYIHAGRFPGTIHRSSNHPMRYEVRGITGAGSLRYICGQVATEGSVNESGKSISIINQAPVTHAQGGQNYYMLLGVRKTIPNRDVAIRVIKVGINSLANNNGVLLLVYNPTLLGTPPVWQLSTSGRFEFTRSTDSTQQYSFSSGRILYALPISSAGGSENLTEDFLTWLSMTISNVPEPIYLVYQPATNNQTVQGMLDLKEY